MRRPPRLLASILVGAACASGWLGGAAPADAVGSPRASLERAVADAKPAKAPFRGLTTARLSVGGRDLALVIADDTDERTQGLRRRANARPYDGMLFAFDGATTTAFTMSTVPVALDIGFYDRRGRLVDRLRMEPCAGAESECPIYRASGPFRYALETVAGDLPRGRLAA